MEALAQHGQSLRQTARRYSLCADDAEDAYQRALEIALTKAPTAQLHELIRWIHTVTKHEALAIRRNRERLLGGTPSAASGEEQDGDWVALIPAADDGPDLRAERREKIARSREALQALKPAELRALTLLAEGYSYAEIAQITGFTRTKVNRCLAEGRERFRALVSRSEDGSRCREMGPLLSAFCDGEAGAQDTAAVREHLRACARCRAAVRAYRATPGAAAALAPGLPLSRSLLERLHEALAGIYSRLPGADAASGSGMAQAAAAGGTPGAGLAALAKVAAVCAGTAGGAAACVAAGVVPGPLGIAPDHARAPTIERVSHAATRESRYEGVEYAPAPAAPSPAPAQPANEKKPEAQQPAAPPPTAPVAAGAVEYTAPAAAPPPPPGGSSNSANGSAAGEFGP